MCLRMAKNGGWDDYCSDSVAQRRRHIRCDPSWHLRVAAMTVLSASAVLALAASCQSIVAPTLILKIAQHESGLDTTIVHMNTDHTRDFGLMQINEKNLAWLGLTERAAFDPCISIAAGAQVLANLSRYNTGSPTKGIAYAAAVIAGPAATRTTGTPSDPPPPKCTAPSWDTWGQQECREQDDKPTDNLNTGDKK
jgi:hypothetical protein